MPEFMQQYGTEMQCEVALIASRWPQDFACSAYGSPASCLFRWQGRLYWQYASCRHQCRVIRDMIFESTKLPLSRWFLAIHLLTQAKNNVSTLELKRHLGASYCTVWLVKHKLLEVMRLREGACQLTGRVEIDDANLGGDRSGGKNGCGSKNRVPFIVAMQTTEDGQPVLACFVPRLFTKRAVWECAATSFMRPLPVVSDGLWAFTATEAAGVHEPVVAGDGKASAKLPQFRTVNTVLSNLKLAIAGTYLALKFEKYAHRYLAEIQYRFKRCFDLRSILPRLVQAVAVIEPQNRAFICEVEVSR